MSTPVATSDESQLSDADLPAEYGLLSGLTAYLLGFGLVYSAMAGKVESALSGINAAVALLGEPTIPTWKAVGWLFYNAHLVATEIPTPGGTLSRDLLVAGNAPVALYLAPPVLLTLAGWGVARQARDLPDVRAGARAGSTVVVGYLLFAVAGAFVISADAFGAPVGPDLLGAAAVVGLLYPIVFGALGGALAALVPSH